MTLLPHILPHTSRTGCCKLERKVQLPEPLRIQISLEYLTATIIATILASWPLGVTTVNHLHFKVPPQAVKLSKETRLVLALKFMPRPSKMEIFDLSIPVSTNQTRSAQQKPGPAPKTVVVYTLIISELSFITSSAAQRLPQVQGSHAYQADKSQQQLVQVSWVILCVLFCITSTCAKDSLHDFKKQSYVPWQ